MPAYKDKKTGKWYASFYYAKSNHGNSDMQSKATEI